MIDQQRAAFEAWAKTEKLPLRRLVNNERYESMETEYALRAYQAALASPEVQALRDALSELTSAVAGNQAGDEPDVYADYDKLCELVNKARAAIEADRQAKGEPPIGYVHLVPDKHSDSYDVRFWKPVSIGTKLYTAPQPTEPSDPAKDAVEEDNRRAAEQACNVLALRLGYVWDGEDWIEHKPTEPVKMTLNEAKQLIGLPETPHRLSLGDGLAVLGSAESIAAVKRLAEPAKVPSDDDLFELMGRFVGYSGHIHDDAFVDCARALLSTVTK